MLATNVVTVIKVRC
jgi:DNA-binding NtrC family response regulator